MKSFLMVIRGFLIGTAEAIPGISGGTVALIVGIYKFLIDSISNFFLRVFGIVNKSLRPKEKIQWPKLALIAIGMALGLILMARLIEPLISDYPAVTFSFFGGLVLASVYYPIRLAGAVSAISFVWLVPGVFVGLFLSGELFEWTLQVATPVAAAFAISALVLPGVSGSFLLLLFGSYESTISALNNLDIGYLASFAAGALIGLVTIVFVVRWFLTNFPKPTYLFMAGLMLGTLPGLFPDLGNGIEERMPVILSAVLGLALVSIFILVERKMNFSSTD